MPLIIFFQRQLCLGEIKDGTKPFGRVEGRKLHGAKMTLYTVFLRMMYHYGFLFVPFRIFISTNNDFDA